MSENYNWVEIQKYYDSPVLLKEVKAKYKLTKTTVNKAVDAGLFVKRIEQIQDVKDYDWPEIQVFYNEGNSIGEIIKKYGANIHTIKKANRDGLFVKRAKKPKRKFNINDLNWVDIQQYYDTGVGLNETIEKYGLCWSIVEKAIEKKLFVKIPDDRVKLQNLDKVYDWEDIQTDYNSGMQTPELRKKYNITEYYLRRATKKGLLKLDPTRKHLHTDESKEKLSKIRKEYLKNNPDKHVWKKHDKFKSKPCEKLKKLFNDNNIEFKQEVNIIEDRNFSADIVFDKIGVILEINGTQHYKKDGTLDDYYQERHELIKEDGWHVIEIFYNLVYNDAFCNTLIDDIKSEKIVNYKEYIYGFVFDGDNKSLIDDVGRTPNAMKLINKEKKPKKNICPECNENEKWACSKYCISCNNVKARKINRPSYEHLVADVKNLGYTGTGKKYGVSDNAIRKWINNYKKFENK